MFRRSKAMVIRTPPGWGWDKLTGAKHAPGTVGPDEYWRDARPVHTVPQVHRIGIADLRMALAKGMEDFGAFRTDVLFLCLIYPLAGLVLARLAFGYELLPLLFPLASGFALIGPFAAVGLNEMSRRREERADTSWIDGFGVFRSPALGQILALGFALIVMLLLWLVCAQVIYDSTLGPRPPASVGQFAHDVFGTPAGWTMIIVGFGVGFLFAVAVLTISSVAFPMLLDRNVPIDVAVRTSVRVAAVNKRVMAVWGLVVAGLLVIGSIPALLGLIVVMPVLGHATWHLYRAAVPH
jgi:uncharacterized membrane protein